MAEIVTLHTNKQLALSRCSESQSEPFKLLFFTGVRYDRTTQPQKEVLNKGGLPEKPAPRKKVRKA